MENGRLECAYQPDQAESFGNQNNQSYAEQPGFHSLSAPTDMPTSLEPAGYHVRVDRSQTMEHPTIVLPG